MEKSLSSTTRIDCPYAAALLHQPATEELDHHDDQASHVKNQTSQETTTEGELQHLEEVVARTRRNCPAFSNNQGKDVASDEATTSTASCPFKDHADSPEAIRETFLKIPPSHYEMGEFLEIIQGLHRVVDFVSKTDGTAEDEMTATTADSKDEHHHGHDEHEKKRNASFRSFYLPGGCPVPEKVRERMSFRDAMESHSLSAIMARMAEELEQEESAKHGTDVESSAMGPLTNDGGSEHDAPTESKREQQPVREVVVGAKKLDDDATSTGGTTTTRLSQSLKTGTAVAHQAAEDVHFVRNFIRGKIDRTLYGQLVIALYHVYDVLEDALDKHAPQYFAACHFPHELRRKTALLEDLDFWHGDSDSQNFDMSPATRDYVDRIRDIAKSDPLLLLAHSYTRYLGDLSGGKILARVARRALNLQAPKNNGGDNVGSKCDGLAFFEFEHIASAKLFKDKYRSALDDLTTGTSGISEEETNRLVAEANVAFLLNMRIFEELDVAANVPGATVRPLAQVLDFSSRHEHFTGEGGEEECPFLKKKQTAGTSSSSSAASTKSGARCPWPFVVFHDPAQFLRDWQTWVLVALVVAPMAVLFTPPAIVESTTPTWAALATIATALVVLLTSWLFGKGRKDSSTPATPHSH